MPRRSATTEGTVTREVTNDAMEDSEQVSILSEDEEVIPRSVGIDVDGHDFVNF